MDISPRRLEVRRPWSRSEAGNRSGSENFKRSVVGTKHAAVVGELIQNNLEFL